MNCTLRWWQKNGCVFDPGKKRWRLNGSYAEVTIERQEVMSYSAVALVIFWTVATSPLVVTLHNFPTAASTSPCTNFCCRKGEPKLMHRYYSADDEWTLESNAPELDGSAGCADASVLYFQGPFWSLGEILHVKWTWKDPQNYTKLYTAHPHMHTLPLMPVAVI